MAYASSGAMKLDSFRSVGIKDILKAYANAGQLNDLSACGKNEIISLRNVLSKLTSGDISESDAVFLKGAAFYPRQMLVNLGLTICYHYPTLI